MYLLRGEVSASFHVVCGCGDCIGLGALTRDEAKTEARKSGWRWFRNSGWTCPACMRLERHKDMDLYKK